LIFDTFLIVGDFNIHVCCPADPLVKDFLNLIDSFNLVQSVNGPTHEHGHTLDLVLSYGISVSYVDVCDAVFSDHKPVIFGVSCPCQIEKPHPSVRLCRRINTSVINEFATIFENNYNVADPHLSYSDPESLLVSFNSVCTTILDDVAPLKVRRVKTKVEPWINDTTRALRQICRRAERKWQKDRLQVSYDILKDSLQTYQGAVKTAKAQYFSDIIERNYHRPRVLFSTINSIVNPPNVIVPDVDGYV
jgi:hypothetical protein